MSKLREVNYEIMKENQNELRELEQFYTDGKVDTMLTTIQERKKALVEDMIEYANTHKIATQYNKNGEPIEYTVDIKPIVISNYFFKSIVPLSCQEPLYNAEKLGMIYDYYCELIAQVNDLIGNFPSSLTLFCKFAGITLATLRRWKNSDDVNMRTVIEKIYDQIGDDNLTMSQLGVVKERSTIFKVKAQNEIVEKVQPNVNVNIVELPDINKVNEKIDKYRRFANKKEKKVK